MNTKKTKLIEEYFPLEFLYPIVRKESNVAARKPIYNMHKWWARRVASTFRAIIISSLVNREVLEQAKSEILSNSDPKAKFENLFYKANPIPNSNNLILLDPFMGGGTTIVEATKLKLKVIGIDLNPVAWFVTKMELAPQDKDKLIKAFQYLEERVGKKISKLYETICPKCGKKVPALYIFWAKQAVCPTCKKERRPNPEFLLIKPIIHRPSRKKPGIAVCPICGEVFEIRNNKLNEIICPNGHRITNLLNDNEKGKIICPRGHKHTKQEVTPRSGWPYPAKFVMYAIEYYCPKHGRGIKKPDRKDVENYERAKKELIERLKRYGIKWPPTEEDIAKFDKIFIPSQRIPRGKETLRLHNYGYKYFWQMFNERQLLVLSLLLEEISKIEEKNIREFMLMVFSSMLEYSNMFCAYNSSKRMIVNLFNRHAYPIKDAPVEVNIWGFRENGNVNNARAIGTGNFTATFLKALQGIKYLENIYEYKYDRSKDKLKKVFLNSKIHPKFVESFEELKESSILILAKDSRDLSFVPDSSVDAVITDPPYYDNVMYSELADFFYVWIRIPLKDYYPWFRPPYTPKSPEIVKRDKSGKDFEEGLKAVWREVYRVLKPEGLLVFTYHYRTDKENTAWRAILSSLLDTGFVIVATYPIPSEMTVSMHIRDTASRTFDTIIVCRKRAGKPEEISWKELKLKLIANAKRELRNLRRLYSHISPEDMSTIVLGSFLKLFSIHWPKIHDDRGEEISLTDALRDIQIMIRSLISEEAPPAKTPLEEFYLRHLVKRALISHDELIKLIESTYLDVSPVDLIKRKFVEKVGSEYHIVPPHERGEKIKNLELPIDYIHRYVYLYDSGKPLEPLPPPELYDDVLKMLEYLWKKTKDKRYENILKLLTNQKKVEKVDLTRWIT